eukprot:CAMPEP_0197644214 /NCGR_PEP_ID=MMETSP1338-20131121/17268_1 /TAXON_ID=43686 ORGANISM="Pelagodinium beii, Strain RCC1491" /NCGR_SAMPLE_ID=MMETSP1338 /ASSEMBLY_ACC=CAM_ASM_000754 /LENGTH=146 /DNA_ID=CAMNT_0043217577 /DNA_START=1 /DNA_END=437 /DNA_ORIENTATION=+
MVALPLPAALEDLLHASKTPYEWNAWQSLMWDCRVSGQDVASLRTHSAYEQVMAHRFGESWKKLLSRARKQDTLGSSSGGNGGAPSPPCSSTDVTLPSSFLNSLEDMTTPIDWNAWQMLVSSRKNMGIQVGHADKYCSYENVMAQT